MGKVQDDSDNNELIRLKEQLSFYKNLIAALPGHVYWKDEKGVFLGCNQLQAEDVGLCSPDEIIGKNNYHLFSKEVADNLQKNDNEIIKKGCSKVIEEYLYADNGEKITYLSHKLPLRDTDGKIIGLLGISLDITHNKQQVKKLKTEKQQIEITLDNMLDNLPGHVYWKDQNFIFKGCNDCQAESAGLTSREDIVGKTDYDMPWKKDADLLRKIDEQVVQTGEIQTAEEPSKLASGKEAVFLSKKIPLRDKQNNIVGVLGISFDITAEKDAERLRLEKKAIEERLGAMRLVSASMAHELRTPLRAINAGINGVQKHLPKLIDAYSKAKAANLPIEAMNPVDFQSLQPVLDSIETETKAAFNVVDMLLVKADLSRITTTEFEVCSIQDCLQNSIERYSFNADEKKLIHRKLTDFKFNGDELLMVHVFFNLFKNAFYYIKAAGKGDIQIWTEHDDKFNYLYFKDTGTGIAKADLPKVFERFFSKTKHGTGIGLAFSKLVLESFGGDIICCSEEGQFTEFKLSFPKI